MYTGHQMNFSSPYPPGERAPYSNGYHGPYSYHRVANQTSRPLEPRPTLHTAHTEPNGISKREEPPQYLEKSNPPYPSRGQNLPGLRDILNPERYSPPTKSYASPWNGSSSTSATQPSPEGYPNLTGLHPPLALHPPTDAPRYASQPERQAYDVPMLATNPLPRHSQTFPLSPNTSFHNAPRDYTDRPPYTSTASYPSNGPMSTYPSTSQGEDLHRHRHLGYHRAKMTVQTLSNVEAPGKYMGIEEVPGEGQFHVYEGGYRIPTSVDGEQVNPAWGLTKANKPRKRLALACLDCREKKIKCEPGANSCSQCEKAARHCRKAPEKFAPNEATTNTLWIAGSPVRKSLSDPTPPSNRETEPDPYNKRRAMADQSPPHGANKKQRSTSPRHDDLPDGFTSRDGAVAVESNGSKESEGDQNDQLSSEQDPYAVKPEITMELLDLYFAHVNNATLNILPRMHFYDWLKRYPHKCANERLVLYAMLAAASVFADDRLAGFGKECARIAEDELLAKLSTANVAAAMSKILLAFFNFAKGHIRLALAHCGSAIRTVLFMNLNTEKGCLDDDVSLSQERIEFAFSREQLAECKRRTFWGAFLQDRFCGAVMCSIKPQDVFVRLPCDNGSYERGGATNAPYFSNDIVDPASAVLTAASPLAPMAWLVVVAAIWGDVCDFLFRSSHRPEATYGDAYESFYQEVKLRCQGWVTRLPDHLQWSASNLDRSIQQGYLDQYISMHTLYHFSLMKLNRYMRHAVLPDKIARNIRAANHHAHEILLIMSTLAGAAREIATPENGEVKLRAFSTPFPGHATLSAIDVVSAGGLDTNLKSTLDEIESSMICLRELMRFWVSAKEQHRQSQKRKLQLENITKYPKGAKSGCWLGRKWGTMDPIEQEFEASEDCIYGLGVKEADEAMAKYFAAFDEDGTRDEEASGGLRIA